jgi:hypothetical protein
MRGADKEAKVPAGSNPCSRLPRDGARGQRTHRAERTPRSPRCRVPEWRLFDVLDRPHEDFRKIAIGGASRLHSHLCLRTAARSLCWIARSWSAPCCVAEMMRSSVRVGSADARLTASAPKALPAIGTELARGPARHRWAAYLTGGNFPSGRSRMDRQAVRVAPVVETDCAGSEGHNL